MLNRVNLRFSKKKIFFVFAALIISMYAHSQSGVHKIVYDLNSEDTVVQSTVLRQFNNVLKAAPDTELELVCHGKAVYLFTEGYVYFGEKIKELKARGNVSFKICANSLKRYNVDPSQVKAPGEIIPVAILELSARQKEGWSYIKAGN